MAMRLCYIFNQQKGASKPILSAARQILLCETRRNLVGKVLTKQCCPAFSCTNCEPAERKRESYRIGCRNVNHVIRPQPLQRQHQRRFSQESPSFAVGNDSAPWQDVIEASDEDTAAAISQSFFVYKDFITEAEEKSLFEEVEPYLKRLHYEKDHWDDAIHGYRETERKKWRDHNKGILQRVRDTAFPPGTPQLAYVHVLDLQKTGVIKAHIDSVKFCGSTIAGISLLSDSVMRLVHDKDKSKYADILAQKRSLYIMTGPSRYDYTHEILGEENSYFRGEPVPRDRRISIICRNEPSSWSEPVDS